MSNEHPAKTFRPFATEAQRAFAAAHAQPDIKTALVIPDTNVLLAPYRGSTETLEAIKKVYTTLRANDRIIVPAQVAREFARNRLDLLADTHKYVRDAKSASVNGKFEAPAILHELPDYAEARRQLDSATEALRTYRSALDRLADIIAGWQTKDPVLEAYERIFDAKTVREVSVGAQTLEEIRTARYGAKIPPGFRDNKKDDGGIGDLVIWLTILEAAAAAKRDAIFITEEAKVDWFHRSTDQKLFPRYELLEEFRSNVPGKAFSIMTLAELLKAHGASERIVAEVRKAADVSEAPFWQAQGQQTISFALERFVTNDVLTRLRAVGADPVRGSGRNHPDVFGTDKSGGLLGVTIALVTGRGTGVYRLTGRYLANARAVSEANGLKEHLMLFVSPIAETVATLDHWFAEDNYQGEGLAAAVAFIDGTTMTVVKNQATHSMLKQAFA